LVVVLGLTGYAVGQATTAKPTTLCAKKSSGALRLPKNGKCARAETKFQVNQVVPGKPGTPGTNGSPGANGAPGRDATPADFAGEPTTLVAAAPAAGGQCAAVARFCTGGNGWLWRNLAGRQAVGFWKDRGGVVHLEGVAELFGGVGGGQPVAFILPVGYRPSALRTFPTVTTTDLLRHVDVNPDGSVNPALGGAGPAPLDGISFRP
jgi:hypothetical protein